MFWSGLSAVMAHHCELGKQEGRHALHSYRFASLGEIKEVMQIQIQEQLKIFFSRGIRSASF